MNNEAFASICDTLIYSWGGDTPVEAHIIMGELCEFWEEETGKKLPELEDDDDPDWDEIIEFIRGVDE